MSSNFTHNAPPSLMAKFKQQRSRVDAASHASTSASSADASSTPSKRSGAASSESNMSFVVWGGPSSTVNRYTLITAGIKPTVNLSSAWTIPPSSTPSSSFPVISSTFNHNNNVLATTSSNTVHLHHASGQLLDAVQTTAVLTSADFGGRSRYLAVGGEGIIKVYDLKKKIWVRNFPVVGRAVGVKFDPTSSVVCGGIAEKVMLYNLKTSRLQGNLVGVSDVTCTDWSYLVGNSMVAGYSDGAWVWDTEVGRAKVKITTPGGVAGARFSGVNKLLMGAVGKGGGWFEDVGTGKRIKHIELPSGAGGCGFSNDGVYWCATGTGGEGGDGWCRVYDLRKVETPVWSGKGGGGVVWDWKVKEKARKGDRDEGGSASVKSGEGTLATEASSLKMVGGGGLGARTGGLRYDLGKASGNDARSESDVTSLRSQEDLTPRQPDITPAQSSSEPHRREEDVAREVEEEIARTLGVQGGIRRVEDEEIKRAVEEVEKAVSRPVEVGRTKREVGEGGEDEGGKTFKDAFPPAIPSPVVAPKLASPMFSPQPSTPVRSTPTGTPATTRIDSDVEEDDDVGGLTPPRTGGGKLTASSLRNSFGSMGSTARKTGVGGGGISRLIVEEVIRSGLEEVRMDLGSAVNAMHVDMIRQFSGMEDAVEGMIRGIREEFRGVVEENRILREENERLRQIL